MKTCKAYMLYDKVPLLALTLNLITFHEHCVNYYDFENERLCWFNFINLQALDQVGHYVECSKVLKFLSPFMWLQK